MDHTALNPANLKPSLTTPDGANLKPSLVTAAYAGGTPSAAGQIKPSLRNADGTLKAGLLTPDGLSLKTSLVKLGGPLLPPNLLVNPEFAGAVAGSPGTAPTDWLYSAVGTPATTVSGAAVTFDVTASRIIAYQTHAMSIGVYELESTVTAAGTQLADLIFPSDWDGFTTFIDDVELAYTTAVNGTKRLKVRVVINTGRNVNFYLGIGLQGSATGVATHTSPTLRKVA